MRETEESYKALEERKCGDRSDREKTVTEKIEEKETWVGDRKVEGGVGRERGREGEKKEESFRSLTYNLKCLYAIHLTSLYQTWIVITPPSQINLLIAWITSCYVSYTHSHNIKLKRHQSTETNGKILAVIWHWIAYQFYVLINKFVNVFVSYLESNKPA